jgi:hypothetical protein
MFGRKAKNHPSPSFISLPTHPTDIYNAYQFSTDSLRNDIDLIMIHGFDLSLIAMQIPKLIPQRYAATRANVQT